MRLLPRFVYRAPLLAVGAPLVGPMAELALALHRPAAAAKANYARRAAFRATPHGLWAGVGVGALGDKTKVRTGPMRASITVAYERLWQAARARLDDPRALAEARVRVAPSLVRDELTATWLAFGEDAESETRAAEIDDVLAAVLDGAADWIEWPHLRDEAGVDDEFLLMLVDDGLLVHDGAPPLVGPPPLSWMAERHDEWAERAEILAAPTAAALATLEDPLHAVLVHEGEVTLSRAAVERAAALAPLLFRLQQALTPPFDERALQALPALQSAAELYGAGAFRLDALALGHYGTPLDAAALPGGDEPRSAVAAVQRAILDAVVGAIVAGARRRRARRRRARRGGAGRGHSAHVRALLDAGARAARRPGRRRLDGRSARARRRQLGPLRPCGGRAARRRLARAGRRRAGRRRRRGLRAVAAPRGSLCASAAAARRAGAVRLARRRRVDAGRPGRRRRSDASADVAARRRAGGAVAAVARPLDDGAARAAAPVDRLCADAAARAVGAVARRARRSRLRPAADARRLRGRAGELAAAAEG